MDSAHDSAHGRSLHTDGAPKMEALLGAYHDAYMGSRVVVALVGDNLSELLDRFCRRPELERALVVRLREGAGESRERSGGLGGVLADLLNARPALRRIVKGAVGEDLPVEPSPMLCGHLLDLLARRILLVIVIDDIDAVRGDVALELGEALRGIEGAFLLVAGTSHDGDETVAAVAMRCRGELRTISRTSSDPVSDDQGGGDITVGAGTRSEKESPSYDYEVVALGRLRVLDRSGAERGARHFGVHKSDSKPRKILAALVTAAVQGRRLSRERLIEMVWGEGSSGDTTPNNFHVTLSGLRQVIGDCIEFDEGAYVLNLRLLRVDAVEFLGRVAEGTRADREGMMFRAYDLFRSACDLYTGEFLEGLYDEWIDGPRDLLRAKARGAQLRLAEIALQRGEHDVARECVRRLLEADTTDEEGIYLQLSILMMEGERIRALREYGRFTRLLEREYGVKPSRRLRELRELIVGE